MELDKCYCVRIDSFLSTVDCSYGKASPLSPWPLDSIGPAQVWVLVVITKSKSQQACDEKSRAPKVDTGLENVTQEKKISSRIDVFAKSGKNVNFISE